MRQSMFSLFFISSVPFFVSIIIYRFSMCKSKGFILNHQTFFNKSLSKNNILTFLNDISAVLSIR